MYTWLIGGLAASLVIVAVAGAAEKAEVTCLSSLPTDATHKLYVSNRPPLAPSPLVKLPIGSIEPRGWLRRMLRLQADGFVGHLTEISRWCRAEGNAWLADDGRGHSPWEELPYWLKGYGDTGYVLGDKSIIAEARKWIEGILSSRQADGWFGPVANKTGSRRARGKPDVWPNMIALNCLQSYYEHSGDKRVLELMGAYFGWQQSVSDEDLLPPFWQQMRAGDNLESIYWLYNRTGDKRLLAVAEKIHRNTAAWSQGVANWHGVNITQCFRQPAIYWMQARQAKFRQAAYRNYDTVMGLYGQVPGGMFGADENCRPGFDDPRQAAESCSMVEFMHSFEMLTKITGDPVWADRCEEVAFNSLPAAMTPDLKGLHYLTAPNMTRLDAKNHSPGVQNGGCMLAYDPRRYRCCQHNVAHGWPYYAQELWLATGDNGLCASLYAASRVTAKVGDGTEVRIVEATDYPFGEKIALTVSAPKAVRFPLYLRVPKWCAAPAVSLNGKKLAARAKPLSYLRVERTWADGDRLELHLPMRPAVTVWKKNHNAVSVSLGPLSFSLKIGEKWVRRGPADEKWPAHDVLPTTPWNYGLRIHPAKAAKLIRVVRKPGAVGDQPFTVEAAPVELRVEGRKIPQWTMDRHGLVAPLQDSPARTSEPVEELTLIPMGCARLRISAFPTVTAGDGGHAWKAPLLPKVLYKASASHCWGGDTPEAMCDELLPKRSNDHSIPRLTWWDHRGTAEWVAYRFKKPRRLTRSDVYWFDDTGRGQCRLPASWRMLYKADEKWLPVRLTESAAYGTAKDRFNEITFAPITAAEVRLEVQLQPGVSGGILEWRVGEEKP